jgi:SAM-dependent MidA family methyltransferase
MKEKEKLEIIESLEKINAKQDQKLYEYRDELFEKNRELELIRGKNEKLLIEVNEFKNCKTILILKDELEKNRDTLGELRKIHWEKTMELKKMKEEEINPTTYSLLWIYLI